MVCNRSGGSSMTLTIQEIIILVGPYVLSALTFIGVIAKVVSSFIKLKKEVLDLKCIDELKGQMKQVLEENYQLKKTLNETMTKIDHVRRD